jgi:hypothetical protein
MEKQGNLSLLIRWFVSTRHLRTSGMRDANAVMIDSEDEYHQSRKKVRTFKNRFILEAKQ